jgi:phenylacetate-CoA ligase
MEHSPSLLAETLRKTQYLPRDRLIEYQRSLLEPLLRHARAHVPFYRESGRLEPLFRESGAVDWDRWSEIPLLTRAEVQAAGKKLLSEALPEAHGPSSPYMTSGSTAEPVRIWQSRLFNPTVRAVVTTRNLERQGLDPVQRLAFLYSFTPADFDIRGVRHLTSASDQFSEPGLVGERFDIADTRSVDELIAEIVAIRPTLLRAQPIVLELMCAHDRGRRLSNLGIAAVLAVGEHLPADVKEEVAAHLNCWVIDTYGSVECGRMANSCPDCGRFHTESETVLVEVCDEDRAATPVGETGWVVATPFYNYAMPLIRYDHADRAIVGPSDRCQITLPSLEAVLGKERTVFEFPGGVVIRATVPASAAVRFLGARTFQVAQVAEDRCEFRVVPGHMVPSEMRFDEMTELLRSIWWGGLHVDYKIVDELPRKSPRGKVPIVVREVELARTPRIRSGLG